METVQLGTFTWATVTPSGRVTVWSDQASVTLSVAEMAKLLDAYKTHTGYCRYTGACQCRQDVPSRCPNWISKRDTY